MPVCEPPRRSIARPTSRSTSGWSACDELGAHDGGVRAVRLLDHDAHRVRVEHDVVVAHEEERRAVDRGERLVRRAAETRRPTASAGRRPRGARPRPAASGRARIRRRPRTPTATDSPGRPSAASDSSRKGPGLRVTTTATTGGAGPLSAGVHRAWRDRASWRSCPRSVPSRSPPNRGPERPILVAPRRAAGLVTAVTSACNCYLFHIP